MRTPEEKRDYLRRWKAAHPNYQRDRGWGYQRLWRLRHPERAREVSRLAARRRQAHDPERIRATRRATYARNAEALRQRARDYHLAHPEVMAESNRRYRARKYGVAGFHFTQDEFREKCSLLGNVCIYCGEARKLEADHKLPLTRGGPDDISNVVPACRSCNSEKHTLAAMEYIERRSAA